MSAGMVNQMEFLLQTKTHTNVIIYHLTPLRHSFLDYFGVRHSKYANSHSELPYTSASYGIWGAAGCLSILFSIRQYGTGW